MNIGLSSVAGSPESTDDIVRFLFTPLFPWEDNLLMPESTVPAGNKLLKVIRFLKG